MVVPRKKINKRRVSKYTPKAYISIAPRTQSHLVFAREYGVAGEELGENAAKGPHVDCCVVRQA